jgi:hypothetical protein
MKKELSPGVLIGAIVGLLAVVGVVAFLLLVKGDPASQAPNAPPTFNASAAAAKEAASHSNPMAGANPGGTVVSSPPPSTTGR